jgi:plasmid stabilization system protein ParE
VKIRELAPALAELDEALGYYGRIAPFFAQALMDEIASAKRLIATYPQAWKKLPGDVRGFHLHRYPYTIIYSTKADEILIVAYAHFRRRPNYWKQRSITGAP